MERLLQALFSKGYISLHHHTSTKITIIPLTTKAFGRKNKKIEQNTSDDVVPKGITARIVQKKKEEATALKYEFDASFFSFVGMTRFELATPRPPDAYSNRTELHPEQRVQR